MNQSNSLILNALPVIGEVFSVSQSEILNIEILKKGMTNSSFVFSIYDQRYIMRIPGEGTSQLINREEETSVYKMIKDKRICDDIIYMNPDSGFKITKYFENVRVCDPFDFQDVKKCLDMLRAFHSMKIKVNHRFDIFEKIDFYEKLWMGKNSVYKDYCNTKEQVWELQTYISNHKENEVLTHIDAVPDNFLFLNHGKKNEEIRLIDWEYAAMQDPHVDIAMFCLYALYDRNQIDNIIDMYFHYDCPNEIRVKIYCYIAACGLLWSNWCEYKKSLGIEFGDYAVQQYKYAKEFYKIAMEELS